MKKTHSEIASYIVCGLLTTAVNFVSYQIAINLGVHVFWAGLVSVTLAKIFAYVSNKLLVFHSHCATRKELGKEMLMFAIVRGASGAVDIFLTWWLTLVIPEQFVLALPAAGLECLFVAFNPATMAKIITQVVVIVLNFVLGKALVFRSASSNVEPETTVAEGSPAVETAAAFADTEGVQEAESSRIRDFMDWLTGGFADIFSRFGDEGGRDSVPLLERLGDFFTAEYWHDLVGSGGLKVGTGAESGAEPGQPGLFALDQAQEEDGFAGNRQTGVFWLQIFNRLCGLLALAVLALSLALLSHRTYSKAELGSDRLYHQQAMFQPENTVGKQFPNCGAVFARLENAYARFCAVHNGFPNLTARQYYFQPLFVSFLVLLAIFMLTEASGTSVSSGICIGLLFVAVLGRAGIVLDGGLFALQSLLVVSWLLAWRLETRSGASSAGIFRCLVLALMCGMPGLTSLFAAFCLGLELVLAAIGIYGACSGRRGLPTAVARLAAVLAAGLLLAWCWGGLRPPFGEIGNNFWMRFAESPRTVCPFLSRSRTLVLICAVLSAGLVLVRGFGKCGLAGLFASAVFLAAIKLAPGIDSSTLVYAGGAVAVAALVAAGLLLGGLADLLSGLFCRYFEFPFLRFAIASAVLFFVCLPTPFACGIAKQGTKEEKSSYLDAIAAEFQRTVKSGDILVVPSPDDEASSAVVMRSIYRSFRQKLKKTALKGVNVLDGNDFMGRAKSFFVCREAGVLWLVTAPANEDFSSLAGICRPVIRSSDVVLLRSETRLHSAQELAAVSAAIYGLCKSDWTGAPRAEACRSLAFLPALSPDCYLNPVLVRFYRLGIMEGLEMATPHELRSSLNDYGLARAASGCGNGAIFERVVKRLPATCGDFPLACRVLEKHAGQLPFFAPSELTNSWRLSKANLWLETDRLDRIYALDPNSAFREEWESMKNGLAKDAELDGLAHEGSLFRDSAGFLEDGYPNGFMSPGGPGELIENGSFVLGGRGWRFQSVQGVDLSSTYVKFPPLRALVETEAGAESGVCRTLSLDKGIYLLSAWARYPEGREGSPMARLMIRPKATDAETAQTCWNSLQPFFSQQTLVFTNETMCSASVFVGIQGSGRPGAAEFTGLTLRKISDGPEWKRDPRMLARRRSAGDRLFYLDEQEELLNRQKELDFDK